MRTLSEENPYAAGVAAPASRNLSIPKLSTWYLLSGFILVPVIYLLTLIPTVTVASVFIPDLRPVLFEDGILQFLFNCCIASLVWGGMIVVVAIPAAFFGNGRRWFHASPIICLSAFAAMLITAALIGWIVFGNLEADLELSWYLERISLIACLTLLPSFTVSSAYAWWVKRGHIRANRIEYSADT